MLVPLPILVRDARFDASFMLKQLIEYRVGTLLVSHSNLHGYPGIAVAFKRCCIPYTRVGTKAKETVRGTEVLRYPIGKIDIPQFINECSKEVAEPLFAGIHFPRLQ